MIAYNQVPIILLVVLCRLKHPDYARSTVMYKSRSIVIFITMNREI